MKRLFLLLLSFGIIGGTSVITAASPAGLTLVYADDPGLVQVFDAKNKSQEVYLGMPLEAGWSVRTGKNISAELQAADASLIRMAPDTLFTYEGPIKDGTGSFKLNLGKVRILAHSYGRKASSLTVSTPLASAGVRGTDFVLVARGSDKDWICVKEGLVQFTQKSSKKEIAIAAGEFADATYRSFEARKASAEELDKIFGDVPFNSVQKKP